HHPNAAANGVGEEEGAFVFGRKFFAVVEGDAAEGRAVFDRAFVFGDDRLAMAVIEEWLGSGFQFFFFFFIELFADIQFQRLELELTHGSLVAGPAGVEHAAWRYRKAVELLDL